MAWKMRDIIDILQLGFTINSAALFLPTIAAIYWRPRPCRRRVLEQQHVARDGDRLAHRRRRRRGRRVRDRSAVAWPARLVRGARRDARRGAQAGRGSRRVSGGPVIVFAEMPEAAGPRPLDRATAASAVGAHRNLHLPRRQGGADRRVPRRRRDPDGLRALRRLGAAAARSAAASSRWPPPAGIAWTSRPPPRAASASAASASTARRKSRTIRWRSCSH